MFEKDKALNPWKKASLFSERNKNTGTTTMASRANVYDMYEKSVQSPSKEMINLKSIYFTLSQELRDQPQGSNGEFHHDDLILSEQEMVKKVPRSLREDFCGTALLCSTWVNAHVLNTGYGIDIDPHVIDHATIKYQLGDDDQHPSRFKLIVGNVLDPLPPTLPKMDLIVALNYSICYFHSRSHLLKYFRKVRTELATHDNDGGGGAFVFDVFGGSELGKGSTVETVRSIDNFKYVFEQKDFDMLTNRVQCCMHFKFKDGSKIKNAFCYDFRVWSIREIYEALVEAGFQSIHLWIAQSDTALFTRHLDEDAGEEEKEGEEEKSSENPSLLKNGSNSIHPRFIHYNLGTIGLVKLKSLPFWNAYFGAR